MSVAKIFEYDIDFVRDVGPHDQFALVYEELWRDNIKLGEGEVLAAEFVNRGARFTAIRHEDRDGGSSTTPTMANPCGRLSCAPRSLSPESVLTLIPSDDIPS